MWLGHHATLTAACVYVVLVGVIAAVLLTRGPQRPAKYRKLTERMLVYAIGSLLWPFLWASVCGCSVESLPTVAYLGLLWPPLLLLADTAFVTHSLDAPAERARMSVQNDANAISAMALTIGGLFVRHVSEGFARAAAPMFLAAVLLILLVVLPTPAFHADSTEANVAHAVQKVALQYCLGLIITSLGITFGVGMRKAGMQGAELKKAMG